MEIRPGDSAAEVRVQPGKYRIDPSPELAADLKAAQEAVKKATDEYHRFIRRTEESWLFIVVRCQVPRKRLYRVWQEKNADGLALLLKEHEVGIFRDYPETDAQGREVRRLRVFKGDREVARRTFLYSFNKDKGRLQVEFT